MRRKPVKNNSRPSRNRRKTAGRGSGYRASGTVTRRAPVKQSRGRSSGRGSDKKEKRISAMTLFWFVFIIFVFILFMVNWDSIVRSFNIIQREMALGSSPESSPQSSAPQQQSPPAAAPPQPSQSPAPAAQPPAASPAPTAQPPATSPPVAASPAPEASAPAAQPSGSVASPAPAAASPVPETAPPASANPAPAAETPAPVAAVQLHDRSVYFIQVDSSGNINRIRTTRRLPASASPMVDALETLMAGPTLSEMERNMISMIPFGSRILSANMRGDVAFINFSGEFEFNTFGAEGYFEQIRQVVFTATEFPNVRSVQILIEGRQIDYIGEGIWIGSPLGRSDF